MIGQQVTLRFENYDRIEVFLEDSSKGFLTVLNEKINSRVKREVRGWEPEKHSQRKLFENIKKPEGDLYG